MATLLGLPTMPTQPPGLPEAPIDTLMYGRQDAVWERAVAVSGDTMSGNLTIQVDPNPNADLGISGDQISALVLGRGGSPRWLLGCTHFSQPGIPFGLYFCRMTADGSAVLDYPFSIQRGNGNVVITTWLTALRAFTTGGDPTEDDELARKAYVDTRVMGLPGPTQTIQAIGNWVPAQDTLRYRLFAQNQLLQVQGRLGRVNSQAIPPSSNPTTICTFPVGFRPTENFQPQLVAAGGAVQTNPVGELLDYGFMQLGTNGDLLFYGHPSSENPPGNIGTMVIYVNQLFPLTM